MFGMKNNSFNTLNTDARAPVPAVAKAARLLRTIAQATEPLGVSELARRAGLSKSTAHGLLAALTDEGFVRPLDEGRGYALGPQLIDLGEMARAQQLLSAAQEEVNYLALTTGETVFFGQVTGNRVVILCRSESSRSLRLSAPVGSSVPLLAGALCKAYTAALPPESSFPDGLHLPAYTDRSITSAGALRREATIARDRGYATERGEYLPGIAAAAVCFISWGTAYFLWSIGIDAVTGDKDLAMAGEALRQAADRIVQGPARQAAEPTRSAS
jgi:DNA-binding IclR family transcriptional regulator